MLYGNNRNDTRRVYFMAWQKALGKQPLEPLEALIVKIIEVHPEYHRFLSQIDNLDKDFPVEQGETNPFIHMGMHIAIQEQLSINQPAGLRQVYDKLLSRHQDPHIVEHMVMECLAEVIWSAQQKQSAPDDQQYMECLQRLC